MNWDHPQHFAALDDDVEDLWRQRHDDLQSIKGELAGFRRQAWAAILLLGSTLIALVANLVERGIVA